MEWHWALFKSVEKKAFGFWEFLHLERSEKTSESSPPLTTTLLPGTVNPSGVQLVSTHWGHLVSVTNQSQKTEQIRFQTWVNAPRNLNC